MNTHVNNPVIFPPVYAYWPYYGYGVGGWNTGSYSYRDNNGNYRNFDYGGVGGYTPYGAGYAYGWNADWGNKNKKKIPYIDPKDFTQSYGDYANANPGLSSAPKSFGIPWVPILGALGGAALSTKLIASWGAGMWDSLLSLGTVALTAAAGAVVASKAADMLNAYGEKNKQRSSAPYHGYSQNEVQLPGHSATRAAGDLDKAYAEYRSGNIPAGKTEDVSLHPQAPFTPTVAKNAPTLPNKAATTYRA